MDFSVLSTLYVLRRDLAERSLGLVKRRFRANRSQRRFGFVSSVNIFARGDSNDSTLILFLFGLWPGLNLNQQRLGPR